MILTTLKFKKKYWEGEEDGGLDVKIQTLIRSSKFVILSKEIVSRINQTKKIEIFGFNSVQQPNFITSY